MCYDLRMCDERDPLVRTEGFRDGRPCVAGTGITVHAIAR